MRETAGEASGEASPATDRYDPGAESAPDWEVVRREFFQFLGGGIVVLNVLEQDAAAAAQDTAGGRRAGPGVSLPREIGAWLHVGEDGRITAYTGKVEVGQDARTSLAQAVADELGVAPASIQLVMGDTDLTPFDRGTSGSRTTPAMAPQLRRAAAAARELLIDLASGRMPADRASLFVADGAVVARETERKLPFGALTKSQQRMRIVGGGVGVSVPTTPAEEWRVAGTPVSRVNGRAIVTGRHCFASDVRRPGMLYGKVLRPPSLTAARVSLDTRVADALPGVIVVTDGDFVGVVAPDELTSAHAIEAIHAEWKETEHGQPSDQEVFEYLKRNQVGGTGGPAPHTVGDVADGLAEADQTLAANYTAAYIAHAPLEPRAAVAEWEGGRLMVWTGTQRPFAVREELAAALGLSEESIRVIVPDTGSGYGGKHTGEVAIEAARLARAIGRPIKLVWTREEEFTWAYFRPAGMVEIRSGVTAAGAITAWECHTYNAGAAGIRTPYAVPHQHIESHPARSPLRQGSYRALAATANHFAREMHMDELAHAVAMDPLAFRRKNLEDPRLRTVLDAAAERFEWGTTTPSPGRGFGIAGGHEKGSYVATCVEVAVDRASGKVKVVRAVTAFECGAIVNPDNLKNQVEGAVIMGIGGALFEAILFEAGRILNARFSRYRVPRFSDLPALETVLLDRKDLPSVGAGETPIVALAPAVGNALFHATGVRLRSLPMVPDGMKGIG